MTDTASPSKSQDLAPLITRLELAAEGSPDLDREIAEILGHAIYPRYTASLDSALTLVPAGRMWFIGHMDPSDMRFAATISQVERIGGATWRGHHAVAALALSIAALRARAA